MEIKVQARIQEVVSKEEKESKAWLTPCGRYLGTLDVKRPRYQYGTEAGGCRELFVQTT